MSNSKYESVQKIMKHKKEMQNKRDQSCIPHCPTCGSTNVRKIPTAKKAGSIIGFGILSNSLGKTYECLNPKCKYKW